MYSDYHVHTSFSGDSETPPENQLQQAIVLGMKQLCLTDHQDMDFPEGDCCFDLDTPAYLQSLTALQEKYRSRLNVCLGVEVGLQPHLVSRLNQYVNDYPFDFVIGSVHLFRGVDPYYPEAFDGLEEAKAYRLYFEEVLENIKCHSCFDVLGHIDYIVRYGPNKNRFYSFHAYADILDEILKTIIAGGKGIECNTGGFRAGLGHPNPCEEILSRYRELGGEILTLGSDAHVPEHLGSDFDRLKELLQNCGFCYYTTFSGRKPKFHPL